MTTATGFKRAIARGLAVLALMCVWGDRAWGQPSNIVLIVADDLGYGDLGCFGQGKIRTPRLDRMASEGMRWTRFYSSAPVCAPARASLLTGLHAGHAPIRDNREVGPEGQMALAEGTRTIGVMLREIGYRTACFGKWGLGGPGSAGVPTKQGFDEFYGYLCQRQAHNYYPTHLWRGEGREVLEGNHEGNVVGAAYSHDLIVEEALKFIREHSRDTIPFFLYVPVTIPHVALQAPAEELAAYEDAFEDAAYDGKEGYVAHPSPHAAYAAMVSRLDRDVGRVLDLIGEMGIEGHTLVVFTSDNGPTHGRAGGADSAFFNSAGGLRGLKGSVYEGGLRVPLIARWPGVVPAGVVTEQVGVMYDLAATFLEIAGAPRESGLDGASLAPTLKGMAEKQRGPGFVYWEFPGYGGQAAVLLGNYKVVRTGLLKAPDGAYEVYDLAADPKETTDVAEAHPEVVEEAKMIFAREHGVCPAFPFPALDGP
jgi:arylsulfatase